MLCGALLLSLAVLYFFDFGGMLHELHCILRGYAEDSFGSGRIYIWKSVLHRTRERLLFGFGPDTMQRAGIEVGKTILAHVDVAHNEYLNILYHQGILALISYFSVLVIAAKKWILGSKDSLLVAALGAMLFCYSVQAFFSFSMMLIKPYFYLVLALLDGAGDKSILG